MSRLEYSRSLRSLMEQAKGGPTIHNHNAWLLKAFQNNQGPLVTEAMMSAQLDQLAQKPAPQTSRGVSLAGPDAPDLEVLRRYMAASAEERAQIDQMAEERAAPLLAAVAADKHAGIREQAKIECTRECFGRDG